MSTSSSRISAGIEATGNYPPLTKAPGKGGATLQHSSISESEWIWYPEGNPAQSAPVGTRYLQRIIHVDAKKALASATAGVSADNELTLCINGKKVSEGDNFHVTVRTSIASFLRPDDTVIAVADANARTVDCPPGFFGGQKLPAGRYTFSMHDPYNAQSPLVPSGLLGPPRVFTDTPNGY